MGFTITFGQKGLCALGLLAILLLSEYHWNIVHTVTIKAIGVREVISPDVSLCSETFKAWNTGIITRVLPEINKDCKKLLKRNKEEVRRFRQNRSVGRSAEPDSSLLQKVSNCSWVLEHFNKNLYITKLEQSFPIAYSFLIHNNSQQILRLFRLLYRPHNQYCIAPDLKSGPEFIRIFKKLSKCLSNVQLVSKVIKISWGHKSIMESQMRCYLDLMKLREEQPEKSKWKYVINLCGKELPLTTPHEIVAHLVKLNGSSVINAKRISPTERETYARLKGQTMPFSLPLGKSMTYMSLSFQFLHFLFTNSTVAHLYNFFKTCNVPEEHFYATVYLIPGVPGGYNPELRHHYFKTNNYFWRTKDFVEKNGKQCEGVIVHSICIVGIGDIVSVLKATGGGKYALFQNKYLMEHDDVIMDCMEERIVDKNKIEYLQDCSNSTIYYKE